MGVSVSEVMTKDVATLSPDMTLVEVDRMLLRRHVSGAPVVDGDRLIGVLSRSDVLGALYEEQIEAQRVSDFYTSPYPIPIPSLEHLARDSRKIADHMIERRVSEIMTSEPMTVRPSDEVASVAKLMASERIHRLPVTQEGRLVGIITSLDIMRVVGKLGLGLQD